MNSEWDLDFGTPPTDASHEKLFFGVNMLQFCEFIVFCEWVKRRVAEYLVKHEVLELCFVMILLNLVFSRSVLRRFWADSLFSRKNRYFHVHFCEIHNHIKLRTRIHRKKRGLRTLPTQNPGFSR